MESATSLLIEPAPQQGTEAKIDIPKAEDIDEGNLGQGSTDIISSWFRHPKQRLCGHSWAEILSNYTGTYLPFYSRLRLRPTRDILMEHPFYSFDRADPFIIGFIYSVLSIEEPTDRQEPIDSTASKYSPEIPLEDILPKSPPVISGDGAEQFFDHLKNYKYPDKLKKFYHKLIRFDTSELEEGK